MLKSDYINDNFQKSINDRFNEITDQRVYRNNQYYKNKWKILNKTRKITKHIN